MKLPITILLCLVQPCTLQLSNLNSRSVPDRHGRPLSALPFELAGECVEFNGIGSELGIVDPKKAPPFFLSSLISGPESRLCSVLRAVLHGTRETYSASALSPAQAEKPSPRASPGLRVRTATMIVTACSPQDPRDRHYYKKHGYKGKAYNICADYRLLPKGTLVNVPGYMSVSYPGKWWVVDAPGGSIIRSATRRGEVQIDVKYRTHYSAKKWGSKKMQVHYILPEDQRRHSAQSERPRD